MAWLEDVECELWRVDQEPPVEEGRRWALDATGLGVREGTVRA